MRSGLQQIQAVLTRASQPQPEPRSAAALQRSFDIEGRTRSGYLGVTCLAEVTPPSFPKAAFQAPSRRLNCPALSVDLSIQGAMAQPASFAVAAPSASLAQEEDDLAQDDAPAPADAPAQAGQRQDGLVQACHGVATVVTAESLAALFAQADPVGQSPVMPVPTELEPVPTPPSPRVAEPGAIEAGQLPALPRAKPPQLSSHQNSINPMLPLSLLQDIGKEVLLWQEALKTVHQKIQDLYQTGQIIEGWLENHPSLPGQYQLCGLDSAGQAWRRSCEPEQLPSVSLAISRYKQLRQLLGEKQRLDHRIQRLSETLTMLRGHLRAY
jgi:hypothetical protein